MTTSAQATRVYSLDVFRGLTMIWMISNGFGFQFLRDQAFWGAIAVQFTHADWRGVYAWDLIQPFFMFIVGAAMPFAFTRRREAGETSAQALRHVLKRSAMLIFWGLVARSIQAGKPTLDLINVLAQVAFTYTVAYLVLYRSRRTQMLAALGLLAVHTCFYLFVPVPADMPAARHAASPDEPWSMPGTVWARNANIGWHLDGVVLGKHWGGGYATINCVSSAANTIFGMMAGWLLFSGRSLKEKARVLLGWGAAGVAAGLVLDPFVTAPLIPNIKKIWTASFALYSTGLTLIVLAALVWLIDGKGWRRGTAVAAMVGANSIFIYLFHEILGRWLNQTGLVFTGWAVDLWGPWGRFLNANLVIAFQVWVCVWLYRRRIFFKV